MYSCGKLSWAYFIIHINCLWVIKPSWHVQRALLGMLHNARKNVQLLCSDLTLKYNFVCCSHSSQSPWFLSGRAFMLGLTDNKSLTSSQRKPLWKINTSKWQIKQVFRKLGTDCDLLKYGIPSVVTHHGFIPCKQSCLDIFYVFQIHQKTLKKHGKIVVIASILALCDVCWPFISCTWSDNRHSTVYL